MSTVNAIVVGGQGIIPDVPDLETQLAGWAAQAMQHPVDFAALGRPKDLAGIEAGLGSMASTLIGAYLNIANGKDPVVLVKTAAADVYAKLQATPMDPTGIRVAGMIADHLGSVPFVNGEPNLAIFPLAPVPVAPTAPATKDKFNAPMAVFLVNGSLAPGFLPVGWLGVEWIGGPGLPANWQDLPAAVALGF